MCCCSKPAAAAPTAQIAGTVFQVDDMTCSHCAGTVRNALKAALPDMKFAIDMEQQRITVDSDPARAAGIIRDAGYDPVIVTT